MIKIPFLKNLRRSDSIGIDWDVQECRWMQLKEVSTGRYHINFLESLPLPEDERSIIHTVKNFVIKNKLEGIPAAIGLQNRWVHVRQMELPKMPMDDLREAVRWQMRDIAEGSIEDYSVQFSILEDRTEGDTTRLSIVGYTIHNKFLLDFRRLLENCGLRPYFIEPAAVALSYSFGRIYPGVDTEWIGLVDLGSHYSTFMAIGKGKLHFVRSLPNVALANTQQGSETFHAACAMEIQRAMDAFSIAHRIEHIHALFLAGVGGGDSVLAESLTKNLGIKTDILNPFLGIENLENFPIASEKPYIYGTAVGLGFLRP